MFLSVNDISKAYGTHQVLNNVSLTLGAGQRIGLVGANGVGKSTLLKIIIGELEADSGDVRLSNRMQIGYLAQVIAKYDDQTLQQMIDASLEKLAQLEAQMRELEAQMGAEQTPEASASLMEQYGDVTEQFERYGGYDIAYRIDEVLNGLRIGYLNRERLFATLSGGEKSRMGLAMLLLQSPDVLLLDEPTNHLDFATLNWLEGYLQKYRGGILIVSHDRQFLNGAVNAIVEIDEHTRSAKRYSGNYDTYHAAKVRERRKWEEDFAAQQEEIVELRYAMKVEARQATKHHATRKVGGDKFAKGFFKGRADVVMSRLVRNAEERLRRIEEDPIPRPPEQLRFEPDFDPQALKGKFPLMVSGISKTFGERCVLHNVSFSLGLHSRVVLAGANGTGKSTLLRILVGDERADRGDVYFHPAVKIGYLDQEHRTLDPNKTVFEAYAEGLEGHEQQLKTILLSTNLFRYEEFERKVGALSSGQLRKLQIGRLIAGGANLLILDEPTNFVSFDILESLEEALKAFPGPVLAASHDRRFMQQFGGEVWELRDGALIPHLNGYEEYIGVMA
ncbi:MAG: ABC-F type ribosomal protection protein [Anaerolineae bacterium]